MQIDDGKSKQMNFRMTPKTKDRFEAVWMAAWMRRKDQGLLGRPSYDDVFEMAVAALERELSSKPKASPPAQAADPSESDEIDYDEDEDAAPADGSDELKIE